MGKGAVVPRQGEEEGYGKEGGGGRREDVAVQLGEQFLSWNKGLFGMVPKYMCVKNVTMKIVFYLID
jgi:hypothetical protein